MSAVVSCESMLHVTQQREQFGFAFMRAVVLVTGYSVSGLP